MGNTFRRWRRPKYGIDTAGKSLYCLQRSEQSRNSLCQAVKVRFDSAFMTWNFQI